MAIPLEYLAIYTIYEYFNLLQAWIIPTFELRLRDVLYQLASLRLQCKLLQR